MYNVLISNAKLVMVIHLIFAKLVKLTIIRLMVFAINAMLKDVQSAELIQNCVIIAKQITFFKRIEKNVS